MSWEAFLEAGRARKKMEEREKLIAEGHPIMKDRLVMFDEFEKKRGQADQPARNDALMEKLRQKRDKLTILDVKMDYAKGEGFERHREEDIKDKKAKEKNVQDMYKRKGWDVATSSTGPAYHSILPGTSKETESAEEAAPAKKKHRGRRGGKKHKSADQ